MNGRRFGLSWLALVALVALAGCSSPTVVTLQNGTEYVTKDKPHATNPPGFIEFTDIAGKHYKIKTEEIASVKAED
ncbi:YgdI/YgdR family lipoprotein [Pseudomonas akapageensis]|uniref:YgdI/YgdR family lipoprotein n=1 Tax=Pseudomonas akapageensis TaxID=2609961 RepID=UPI001409B6D1|nr:YgdI/YgdR family lipoprotein [Pseudomonas akapageensis]